MQSYLSQIICLVESILLNGVQRSRAKAWPVFNLTGQVCALNLHIFLVTCSMFLITRLPGRAKFKVRAGRCASVVHRNCHSSSV